MLEGSQECNFCTRKAHYECPNCSAAYCHRHGNTVQCASCIEKTEKYTDEQEIRTTYERSKKKFSLWKR